MTKPEGLYENLSIPVKGNAVISRSDLTRYYDTLLSPSNFEDYAPNGLQVEGKLSVKNIAFAVSATQESVKEALEWGADALVVHHGLFWKHQGARTLTGGWGKRVMDAVKAELNIFGYHLPLDSHPEVGNAVALAEALGLEQLAPFGMYKRQPLGASAKLKAPMPAEDFQKHLAKVLSHDVIMASHDPKAKIQSVGIITGGANNEWPEALKAGLDAYITGEISEYNWHDCKEAGIHYFAGGHHATEKFGIQSLMHRTLRDNPSFQVKFFDSHNPV